MRVNIKCKVYPHGRDAIRERVPTIAAGRDLHVFPYVDAHGRPPDRNNELTAG
jgi:hypothetical protein